MAYNKSGFTILELMIAMTVFAVAVMLVMSGVIFIGRTYQQASSRISLEDTARQTMKDLEDTMKFSGVVDTAKITQASGNYEGYCLGSKIYVFGKTASPDTITDFTNRKPGMYFIEDLSTSCQDSLDSFSPANYNNLLPEGAKVSEFSISSSQPYKISIRLIKSYEDLLESLSGKLRCKTAVSGREWCALAELDGIVIKRIKE